MNKTNTNPWPTLIFVWSGIGVAFAIWYNLQIG